MQTNQNHISTAEAAELLGVDTTTVHRRIARGVYSKVTKFPGLRAPFILDREEVLSHLLDQPAQGEKS